MFLAWLDVGKSDVRVVRLCSLAGERFAGDEGVLMMRNYDRLVLIPGGYWV